MPNFETMYSNGPSFVNLGIFPYPIGPAAPRGAICLQTGGGWGTGLKGQWEWGALECPRRGTLCLLSMIDGTDLPHWAI